MSEATDAPSTNASQRRFSLLLLLRTLAGLILAPTVGGAIILGGSPLIDSSGGDPDIGSMAIIGAYLGLAYGIVPALLIGWPVHLILLRQRWTHPLVYIGLGAGIGISALFLMGFADGTFNTVAGELNS